MTPLLTLLGRVLLLAGLNVFIHSMPLMAKLYGSEGGAAPGMGPEDDAGSSGPGPKIEEVD